MSAAVESIAATLAEHQVVILAGATGSGKTTQIPKICLAAGRGLTGMIGLTQPRRLAAHSVAKRIAEETRLSVGKGIGVQVRFDDQTAPETRLKVMTDGILLNEVARDSMLSAYDTIIVDEAHERSLNIDFLLGCLKKLLPRRPELKLIVTSATINTEAFSNYFDNAPVIEVSGRSYPVDIEYQEMEDRESLPEAITRATGRLAQRLASGDLLVFLPGEREINEARLALEKAIRRGKGPGSGWEVISVYGRLADKDQQQIFAPGRQRRIVLATNVAETSITVPRIVGVIDSGIARISRYSYRTRIQRLSTEPVSQASASQRAGRCGRLGPGVCIRLYSEDDFVARREFTDAEIRRTNLASVILRMLAARLGKIEAFPFIEPPDASYIRDGAKLLQDLSAIRSNGSISSLGRELARMPVDPRLARVVHEAARLGVLDDALIVVAALSTPDPRVRPIEFAQKADAAHAAFKAEHSDLAGWLTLWRSFRREEKRLSRRELRDWMEHHYLAPRRLYDWRAVYSQLRELAKGLDQAPACTDEERSNHLSRAFIVGFPDQIAVKKEAVTYTGTRSSALTLHPASALGNNPPPWIVAATLIRTSRSFARDVARIEPEWVLSGVTHLLKYSYGEARWDCERREVRAIETTSLYGLILRADREVHLGERRPELAHTAFVRHALVRDEAGLDAGFLVHNRQVLEEIEQLEGRVRRSLRIGEDAICAIYSAALPRRIASVSALNSWLVDAQAGETSLLNFSRDVLVPQAAASDASGLPDSLELAGSLLPLRYRFRPGESDDGARVYAPTALREYLSDAVVENAVPDLLEKRVELHLRALPKSHRQRLHPMRRAVKRATQSMLAADDDMSFRERLSRVLAGEFGIDPTSCKWDSLEEPDYLIPKVEFEDSKATPESAPPEAVAMPASKDWVFGTLSIESTPLSDSAPVRKVQALAAAGDEGARLANFSSDRKARESHARAVGHLARLQVSQQRKILNHAFRNSAKRLLVLRELGEELASDFEEAALLRSFPQERAAHVLSEADYKRLLDAGRAELVAHGERLSAELVTVAGAYQEARTKLSERTNASDPAHTDISEQLAGLVFPGFLVSHGADRLAHLARYLTAIARRLEKLPTAESQDAAAMAVVRRFQKRLAEVPFSQVSSAQANDFRWGIEELRVSLFAQQLGTAGKISEKRLDKLWAKLLGLA